MKFLEVGNLGDGFGLGKNGFLQNDTQIEKFILKIQCHNDVIYLLLTLISQWRSVVSSLVFARPLVSKTLKQTLTDVNRIALYCKVMVTYACKNKFELQ